MLRSAHLALSHVRFPAQFDFSVSQRYSYEKRLHRWVRRDGLISALVTTSIPRLKARAWCGDLRWDEPISPSQRCRMHMSCVDSYVPKRVLCIVLCFGKALEKKYSKNVDLICFEYILPYRSTLPNFKPGIWIYSRCIYIYVTYRELRDWLCK